MYNSRNLTTQNGVLLQNLVQYYKNPDHLKAFISVIKSQSRCSLRIIDWMVVNYAKAHFTVYDVNGTRSKIYQLYKQNLRSYGKRNFDCFKRWDRLRISYNPDTFEYIDLHAGVDEEVCEDDSEEKVDGEPLSVTTTLGQMNFFRFIQETKVIEYINENYESIEKDMLERNSSSRKQRGIEGGDTDNTRSTRRKRQELSVSATRILKKEDVVIKVSFK